MSCGQVASEGDGLAHPHAGVEDWLALAPHGSLSLAAGALASGLFPGWTQVNKEVQHTGGVITFVGHGPGTTYTAAEA